MNAPEFQTHSFSRKLAREYGDTEALLLGYLGNKICRSKQKHDNRTWYFESLDELARRYPYLSRSAIHNALAKLSTSTGPLITGNYNKKGYDRTKWYAFRHNQAQRHLQVEPAYFKANDAEKYGVVEAVLLMNLAHWIHKNCAHKPDYQYHKMSPQELAKVLPYSESTIKRALKHLANEDVGVLQVRRPDNGRGASEYSFVDENQLQNYGAVNTASSSNLDGLNANLNMGGPKLDLTGSNPNMSGLDVDITGSKLDDYTILIDNSFEDISLKEESLKDRHFKGVCVSGSNFLPASANLDSTSTATSDSATNTFQEPVEGDTNVIVVTEAAESADAVNSSSSKPASSLTPASPSPVQLAKTETKKPPFISFLDSDIDGKNWELIKSLSTIEDEDDMRLVVADLAVQSISELVRNCKAEDLLHFARLPNQRGQDEALISWATPFFNEIYEKYYSRPECSENEEYRAMFIHYCQRILSMAFHWIKFPDSRLYVRQQFTYQASLAISRIISPWLEEQQRQRQIEDIKRRGELFKSQDQHLENRPSLSASEKMQVFNQSLMARNRVGTYDDRGKFVQQVVRYNQTTNKLVREFFQLNHEFTVRHLNLVLDECVKLPAEYYDGDQDPQWHARNGRDITRFIRSLDIIAGQLNLLDQVPAITPLPPHETDAEDMSIESNTDH